MSILAQPADAADAIGENRFVSGPMCRDHLRAFSV
jgi:hypothetical protein